MLNLSVSFGEWQVVDMSTGEPGDSTFFLMLYEEALSAGKGNDVFIPVPWAEVKPRAQRMYRHHAASLALVNGDPYGDGAVKVIFVITAFRIEEGGFVFEINDKFHELVSSGVLARENMTVGMH